eukprot:m.246369 g.246369  ORF g.246369 m.246369 type:complete len:56 (+) comp16116_c0_seq33:1848-2015(+)
MFQGLSGDVLSVGSSCPECSDGELKAVYLFRVCLADDLASLDAILFANDAVTLCR